MAGAVVADHDDGERVVVNNYDAFAKRWLDYTRDTVVNNEIFVRGKFKVCMLKVSAMPQVLESMMNAFTGEALARNNANEGGCSYDTSCRVLNGGDLDNAGEQTRMFRIKITI